MTELELYKFIKNYNIEYHWYNDDILIMVDYDKIKYFHEILDNTIFDDNGIDCTMKDGYIVFEMKNICDYYGIDLENVFDKNKK